MRPVEPLFFLLDWTLQYCKMLQPSIDNFHSGYDREKINLHLIAWLRSLKPSNQICNRSILHAFVLKDILLRLWKISIDCIYNTTNDLDTPCGSLEVYWFIRSSTSNRIYYIIGSMIKSFPSSLIIFELVSKLPWKRSNRRCFNAQLSLQGIHSLLKAYIFSIILTCFWTNALITGLSRVVLQVR